MFIFDLCPRPVSRSPYTIIVGRLRSGNTALPWEVETGATGTQPLTGAAVWSLTNVTSVIRCSGDHW